MICRLKSLVIAIAVFPIIGCVSTAQKLENFPLDQEYWAAYDWFDTSAPVPIHVGEQLRIGDLSYRLSTRVQESGPEIVSSAHLNVYMQDRFCTAPLDTFSNAFGSPTKNDSSYGLFRHSESNFARAINVYYQWDIGDTRITASCAGNYVSTAPAESGPFRWGMEFTHQSRRDAVTPSTLLRCKHRPVDASGMRVYQPEEEDFFRINEFANSVSNTHFEWVGINFEADENEFRFTNTTIHANVIYTVYHSMDRHTGAYAAKYVTNNREVFWNSGICEAVDPPSVSDKAEYLGPN